MGCKTNFLKIDFDNFMAPERAPSVTRCCALQSVGIQTPITLSDEIVNSPEKFREYILEKAYELPPNLRQLEIGTNECKSKCENAYTREGKITQIALGIQTCNLHCKMCRPWQTRPSDPKTVNAYFTALEAFKGMGVALMPNLSGEVFYYKRRMLQFLQNCKQSDYTNISITTNATLIDDEVLETLRNSKIFTYIAISIDSVIEETYKKIRLPATSEMFKKVLHNIDELNKICKMPGSKLGMCVTTTLIDINSTNEELTAYGDYFSSRGIDIQGIVAFGGDDGCLYRDLVNNQNVLDFVKKYNVNMRIS